MEQQHYLVGIELSSIITEAKNDAEAIQLARKSIARLYGDHIADACSYTIRTNFDGAL
jgi:hypothetical protein